MYLLEYVMNYLFGESLYNVSSEFYTIQKAGGNLEPIKDEILSTAQKEPYIDPYYLETPEQESLRIRTNRQFIIMGCIAGVYYFFAEEPMYTYHDGLIMGLCIAAKILCRG